MSNANITINQYQELLKRITGLEHKVEHKELPVDIYKDVDELKEDYPVLKKAVATTDIKFNSLGEKMDYRFDLMDEKFNTQNEKFNSLHIENKAMRREMDKTWKLLIMMFGISITTFIAILTVIGLLLRILSII